MTNTEIKKKQAPAKAGISHILAELSLPILLVVLIILFSCLTDKFFTPLNLTNVLVQNVHIVVLSIGVMLIMISGGCDLSMGYQMAVTSVLITKLISNYNCNPILAIAAGIALSMVLGTFNGVMAIKLKSHAMIVTLGTMAIFQGIAYLISESKTYYKLPVSYMFIGQGRLFGFLPLNAVIMIVILVIASFVISKTILGRQIYAAGDNPEAARLSGLKVAKIKVLTFTSAGFLVGVAAVLMSSRNGSADAGTGTGLEFTGITACVLAGVALKGGEGKLWKVVFAVFVLGVLSNGMQLINLGTYPQYIAKGVIMLLAIYLSNRNLKALG